MNEEIDINTRPLNMFEAYGCGRDFAGGSKLSSHIFNEWTNVRMWLTTSDRVRQQLGPLKPMNHYEELVRKSFPLENVAQEVMTRSDPDGIIAFDTLADEFNAHLEEISLLGFNKAELYLERARKLQKQYCE